MSASNAKNTVLVALVLCVVCSIAVSTTAVLLRPKQVYNKEIDVKSNILMAAGLLKPEEASPKKVEELFSNIKPVVVNLKTGEINTEIDPAGYEMRAALKDPEQLMELPEGNNYIGFDAIPKNMIVYLYMQNGEISQVILPIISKGLWSTMYGFIALAGDLKTVKGFAYYEHGETPGLGGEVDNPKWKQQWIGKQVYDENWEPKITVIKGSVSEATPYPRYKIDGLSGATITSNGVRSSMDLWMGKDGYRPFIMKIRDGEIRI